MSVRLLFKKFKPQYKLIAKLKLEGNNHEIEFHEIKIAFSGDRKKNLKVKSQIFQEIESLNNFLDFLS
jgi:hypothetical protein